jgi:hypothetical protein
MKKIQKGKPAHQIDKAQIFPLELANLLIFDGPLVYLLEFIV